MKLEEIREKYSMRDILDRCNVKVVKGFCSCPFHKGDRTPSMKVYAKSFYCFGCNTGGDVIKFAELYHNLSFEDACEWISGEKLSYKTKRQIVSASMRRQAIEKKRKQLTDELRKVNTSFSGLWQTCLSVDPLSEEWKNTYNKWQYLCYSQECIIKELGAL